MELHGNEPKRVTGEFAMQQNTTEVMKNIGIGKLALQRSEENTGITINLCSNNEKFCEIDFSKMTQADVLKFLEMMYSRSCPNGVKSVQIAESQLKKFDLYHLIKEDK